MALEIAYFTGSDTETRQCYGLLLSSASPTLSPASASCGAVPATARIARLKAGENCRVTNNGATASATNGVYLSTGDIIDIQVAYTTPLFALTV